MAKKIKEDKTIKENKKVKENKKKKSVKIKLIAVILVCLLAGGFGTGAFMLSPASSSEEFVIINVPEGSSLISIANILKENGLIRSPLAFRIYVKLSGKQSELKAGRYTLTKNMSSGDILKELVNGQKQATITLVIREGLDLNRVSAYLEETGLFTAQEFLDEIKNNFAYYKEQYSFLSSVPATREYPLEGYLFGDTYEVYADASPRDVIIKMLDGFQAIWKDEYTARCKELGYTIDQIVTMASIVEREGILDSELPTIAGVFYNRISRSMLLQSCATLQYIYKDYQFTFTSKQMKVENPYNTYLYKGLPPGPIANFRVTALLAALYPESHEYLYFCSKNDGSGGSAFAKTLAEHESNISKYSGNWK